MLFQILDKTCSDGLVFDEAGSIQFAKCGFPFSIDCTGRPELQKAKPTGPECPRQNGYFPHENPAVCDKFYFCVDGVPNAITCPASLIFDPKTVSCEKYKCAWTSYLPCLCKLNPIKT